MTVVEGPATSFGPKPLNSDRPKKVLEALHDVVIRYPTEFAIFPIIDTLQLLIQKPVAFSIIPPNAAEPKDVFTTFGDVEYQDQIRDKKLIPLIQAIRVGKLENEQVIQLPALDGSYKSQIDSFLIAANYVTFKVNSDDPKNKYRIPQFDFLSLNADEYRLLAELFSLLAAELRRGEAHAPDFKGTQKIILALERAPSKAPQRWSRNAEHLQSANARFESEGIRLDYDADKGPGELYNKYQKWMRDIVTDAYNDFAHSHLVSSDRRLMSSGRWVNLFFVLRRAIPGARRKETKNARPHFHYTLQYVLPRQFLTKEDEATIATFEIPVGQDGRAIADWIFHTGTAEFSPKGMISSVSYVPGDKIDEFRDLVEQQVLEQPGDRLNHLFFVPVHVGGAVWAVLFTLTRSEGGIVDDIAWTHNYLLYRVLMAQIAERLRIQAKRSYFDRIVEVFDNAIIDEKKSITKSILIDSVNTEWEHLTAFFPYAILKLKDIYMSDDGHFRVRLTYSENPHPCFKNILSDNPILDGNPTEKNISQAGLDLFSNEDVRFLEEILNRAVVRLELRRTAQQTAAVAIISRNMSHNLGSHPIAEMAHSKRVLEECYPAEAEEGEAGEEIARFFRYIRDRSDYIAELATGSPTWALSYDLLQVIEEFQKQVLLRKYLTERELIPCEIRKCDPSTPGYPESFDIALPQGVLGMQALYSIFENCLRNSVRHGRGDERGTLIAEIKDVPGKDDVLQLTLLDCGSAFASKQDAQTKANELNGKLGEPFYGHDEASSAEQLVRRNWGLKEKKISAAFLRCREAHIARHFEDPDGTIDYEESTVREPWVKAVPVDQCVAGKAKHHFGWRLLLLRPKRAAVVGESLYDHLSSDEIQRAKRLGFSFFSDACDLDKKVCSEPFIVIAEECWERIRNRLGDENRSTLPPRFVVVSPTDINDAPTITGGWLEAFVKCLTGMPQDVTQFDALLYGAWNRWLTRQAHGSDAQVPLLIIVPRNGVMGRNDDNVQVLTEDLAVSRNTAEFQNVVAEFVNSEGRGRLLSVFEHHAASKDGIHKRHIERGSSGCEADNIWSITSFYAADESNNECANAVNNATHDSLQAHRLIESSLVWIIVIDERICKLAYGNEDCAPAEKDQLLRKREMLARCGILFWPFRDLENLTRSDLESPAKKLDTLLKDAYRLFAGRPGKLFVSAHLSVLQSKTVFGGNLVGMDQWAEQIERWGKRYGTELVIHSGRGRPPELDSPTLAGFKFVQFSNLERWVMVPGNKPLIVDLFMSVRHGTRPRGFADEY